MTRSLRARLLGSMFVVTALVVGSALFIADPLVRTRAKDDVVRALDLAAADALRGGDRDPAAHVTWIDAEGEIAARTGGPGGGSNGRVNCCRFCLPRWGRVQNLPGWSHRHDQRARRERRTDPA